MYEGRNGWWLYDERTSQEIEKSFKKSDLRCELLIAGFLYIIGKELNNVSLGGSISPPTT